MKRIKLTQGKYALVDDEDYEKVNQLKWYFESSNGYAVHKSGKKIYMHRFINQTPDGFETDHINRNRLDNRKFNLRTADRSKNSLNTKVRVDNKLGHKGIIWRADRKKFYTYFKGKYLGYFKTIKEALVARKEAEQLC